MTQETQILKPSRLRNALYLLLSLLFVAGGMILVPEEGLVGWISMGFFGLVSLIFAIQLLPGASVLTLTAEGFEIKSLFRARFTHWEEVKAFQVGYVGMNKRVVFDYVETYQKKESGRKLAKAMGGHEGGLPDNYGGMSAEALSDLMNTWKSQGNGF
ncbi:MAG: hypothetical protein H6581_24490 [Bacteroidia bacterium]|nr:hypothetical protein [Bacteroidia bacterium]